MAHDNIVAWKQAEFRGNLAEAQAKLDALFMDFSSILREANGDGDPFVVKKYSDEANRHCNEIKEICNVLQLTMQKRTSSRMQLEDWTPRQIIDNNNLHALQAVASSIMSRVQALTPYFLSQAASLAQKEKENSPDDW